MANGISERISMEVTKEKLKENGKVFMRIAEGISKGIVEKLQ